jgi:KDO2-lipid IV(A) lauroyltransferase
MQNAFPDKTKQELRRLERRFYHHFADYIMETIKLAHISIDELLRRAAILNKEVVFDLQQKGHTCLIMMMGHYGNWEWYVGSSAHFNRKTTIYPIYRPLSNKTFDRMFIYLRERFHAVGIKKKEAFRDLLRLKQNQTQAIVPFIADQTPSKGNLNYWTDFLHQETAILTGPERIAAKLEIPVIFADVRKIKRGYYTVHFRLITENPKTEPEFWITEQYARMTEEMILRDPAFWLWTHKRWKHSKELKIEN